MRLCGADLQRNGHRLQHRFNFLGQNGFDHIRLDAFVISSLADQRADARRQRQAQIGLDQQILQLFQRCSIKLALGENIRNALRQSAG